MPITTLARPCTPLKISKEGDPNKLLLDQGGETRKLIEY
jgi:hypothetical protein